MYTLINENDIRNDNGELMGFDTHIFRHTYGLKFAELHLDDAQIAHLLGHRGSRTVYRYRRVNVQFLKNEIMELSETMETILSEIIKERDRYK